jgi:fatty-acyl-CoA synthase
MAATPRRSSSPLLVVYTSGTTGRPKGAVLRQEALVWNAAMSQHAHGLPPPITCYRAPAVSRRRAHIQTTPALQAGAHRDDPCALAPRRDARRPGRGQAHAHVLVPATIQGADPASALDGHRSVEPAARSTTGSTIVPLPLIDALTRAAVPVLQVYGSTETCPIAIYTPARRRSLRGSSTGLPGLYCEARIGR